MLYGDEKRRQMARSILPSTRSRGAGQEKACLKRACRHGIKRDLRRALLDEEYGEEADLTYYPEHKIRYVVYERRNGDKVNHFIQWAKAVTKDVPQDSRISAVRSALPESVIGWHAVQHLRFDEHFRCENHPWNYSKLDRWKPAPKVDWAENLRQIVVTPDAHRMFNQYMNYYHKTVKWEVGDVENTKPGGPLRHSKDGTRGVPMGPERARTLGGLGDIKTFLEDLKSAHYKKHLVEGKSYMVRQVRYTKNYWFNVPTVVRTYISESPSNWYPNPQSHPEWWSSMCSFVNLWIEARGDVKELREKVKKEIRS